MEEEIKMIEKNETWESADLPRKEEVNGVEYVYKTKLNLDGLRNTRQDWLQRVIHNCRESTITRLLLQLLAWIL